MQIVNFITRLMHRADRFEAMVVRLGVGDELERLSDRSGVVDRAVDRCLGCDQTGPCQQWLDQNETAPAAPDYCPNHDLFERLMKVSTASRTAATTP
ncbi:hypothetical protein DFR52_101189 [Hoeflea marina]|uniref:DUF6455 domain-containing protein n=1 Tax=Hoeflea marina TaxID=274592 RepID=A0A317PPR9_9HYPH|nr:DUF6455 family protein [Hoeflea marina]PWW03508.1 hypothetical protein DFR52_101189 [Hoeflea marina]